MISRWVVVLVGCWFGALLCVSAFVEGFFGFVLARSGSI